MATQVTCWFTKQSSVCSHDVCRINREAEKDYINSMRNGGTRSQQREYFIKFQKLIKSIQDIWEIFRKRDINLVPPEWQEVYLTYIEGN
jgi:hypothetical protein